MPLTREQRIEQLEEAMGRPERSITSRDRSVTLKDQRELEAAAAYQRRALVSETAITSGTVRSRFRRIMVDKNL